MGMSGARALRLTLTLAFAAVPFLSQSLLEQGNQALDAKQYDRAIAFYRQASDADAKDYAARFQLALTLSLLGKDEEAIPQYESVLALQPGLFEAELNLGMSLARLERVAVAIAHIRAASEIKPKEFTPWLLLGQTLFNVKDYPGAEAAFRKALEIDARSAPAESGLALSLGRQAKVDEAAPHFQQAFNLDRTYRSAFVELAQLYEANKRIPEAITFYKMFPDNVVALEHLGRLLMEAGNYEDAIPALEMVAQREPSPERSIALAEAFAKTNQPAKALAALSPAVGALPSDAELRMFRGRLLRDQRKFRDAAADFLAATRLEPKRVEAWNELAYVLVMNENYAGALSALDRSSELSGETPGNMFYRALTLDHLDQHPQAIAAYDRFLANSQGKLPDQEFQARQRKKTLEIIIKKK